jgi:hypothetical protein
MADDRTLIYSSFLARQRANAAGRSASARPCAPGRARANPAGNLFPSADRRMPALWALPEISSSAVAVVVAKLCRRAAWSFFSSRCGA